MIVEKLFLKVIVVIKDKKIFKKMSVGLVTISFED